jgi:hypothetical protein
MTDEEKINLIEKAKTNLRQIVSDVIAVGRLRAKLDAFEVKKEEIIPIVEKIKSIINLIDETQTIENNLNNNGSSIELPLEIQNQMRCQRELFFIQLSELNKVLEEKED